MKTMAFQHQLCPLRGANRTHCSDDTEKPLDTSVTVQVVQRNVVALLMKLVENSDTK